MALHVLWYRAPSGRLAAGSLASGPSTHSLSCAGGVDAEWASPGVTGAGASGLVHGADAGGLLVSSAAAAAPGDSGPLRPWAEEDGCVERVPVPVGGELDGLLGLLRDRGAGARGPVRSAVATLTGEEDCEAWFCLGPPRTGVFVRHWGGLPLGPDVTPRDGAGAPLAEESEMLARRLERGELALTAVRTRLEAAQLAAVEEGLVAEHQARLMDAEGDDHGAAVRRLVAQAHGAALARAALAGLLGAPSGGCGEAG